jgi:hypothetical protein
MFSSWLDMQLHLFQAMGSNLVTKCVDLLSAMVIQFLIPAARREASTYRSRQRC